MATENPNPDTTGETTEEQPPKPVPELVWTPMRRGLFDGIQGHRTPEGFDPAEMGWYIEYMLPDGRNPGYSRWCRQDELDAALAEKRGADEAAEAEASGAPAEDAGA